MRKLFAAVALVGMLLLPGAAQAQLTIGPVLAYHDEFDFGIGGYVGIPVPSLAEGLSINPNFEIFFPEGDRNYFELNGDVVYQFEVSEDTPVLPFALGGLSWARASGGGGNADSRLGVNLGGGIGFRAESVLPFVGGKFEIEGGEGFVIFGGVGFPMGG